MGVTVGEVSALITVKDEMNAKLKEAQQNTKDLGQAFNDVGGNVTKFSDNVDKGSNSMDQMDRIATRMIERMAILFAVKGTEQFIQSLFTGATAIQNLSTNLDVSTEKVQEFQYAATQTGIAFATLTGAADTFGKKLASGSDSVTNALQQLGLDTNQFFDAEPGERFDEAARAISEMGDKTARTGAEMALFGTDKIDPVIMKLQELEKAAHDTGNVMGDDVVKKLADADKAFASTYNSVKILASEIMVAYQDAVAFAALNVGNFITNTPSEQSSRDAMPVVMPTAPGAPRQNLPGQIANAPLDPNKPKELAAIAAIERDITGEVRNQIAAEKEQAAFEKYMFDERMQIAKKVQEEMKKTTDAFVKATNDQVQAELAAKIQINAAYGLNAQGVPNEVANDPLYKAQQATAELGKGTPGINTSAQQQLIADQLIKAQQENATVVVGMTAAEREAAKAATDLSTAHAGAVQVSGMLSTAQIGVASVSGGLSAALRSAANAAGVFMSTVSNFGNSSQGAVGATLAGGGQFTASEAAYIAAGGFIDKTIGASKSYDVGGPTGAGGPALLHADEYVVPKGGALVMGGGGQVVVNLTVQGNVIANDPASQAAFSQLVHDAVQKALPGGSRARG